MKKAFQRTALYTGTYDPITLGHLEVIGHAAKICDKLIIGVGKNAEKTPLFTPGERVDLIRHEIETSLVPQLRKDGVNCEIDVVSFDGLTAKFMQAQNISISVRGIRSVKDFSSEESLAMANADLFTKGRKAQSLLKQFTQILIYSTNPDLIKVSSSAAREICAHGADNDLLRYVSPYVRDRMIEKMAQKGLRNHVP